MSGSIRRGLLAASSSGITVVNPALTSPTDGTTFTGTFEAFGWTTTNNQGYTHFRTIATWSGGSSTGSITTGSGQNLISLPDGGETITVQLLAGTQDEPGFEAVVADTHTYIAYTAALPAALIAPANGITYNSNSGDTFGESLLHTWTIGSDDDATGWRLEQWTGGSLKAASEITNPLDTSKNTVWLAEADGATSEIRFRKKEADGTTYTTKTVITMTHAVTIVSGGPLTIQATPITVTTNNTIIEDLCFTNITSGVAIDVLGATGVIIRNCRFEETTGCITAQAGSDDLEIEGNYFHNVGGAIKIYSSQNPKVHHNACTRHGVLDSNDVEPGWWANNFVQFDNCSTNNADENCYDNIIDWNQGRTTTLLSGHGLAVDCISVAAGTSGSSSVNSFKVARNIIRGMKGLGTQAAGAIVADWGTNYISVTDNKMLNYGQYCWGSAKTANFVGSGNLAYNELGHGHNSFNATTNLIKHPSDGANSDTGFAFVFSPYDDADPGPSLCINNTYSNNDCLGFTYWGYKGMGDNVDTAGGTLTEDQPSGCTGTVYTSNNVALTTGGHPNLVSMVSDTPFTTVATTANGYFDRTQTCS